MANTRMGHVTRLVCALLRGMQAGGPGLEEFLTTAGLVKLEGSFVVWGGVGEGTTEALETACCVCVCVCAAGQ